MQISLKRLVVILIFVGLRIHWVKQCRSGRWLASIPRSAACGKHIV